MQLQDINLLVMETASQWLQNGVADIATEEIADSAGDDALRIQIILKNTDIGMGMTGEQCVRILVEVHDQLLAKGDTRFPHIEYWTKEELEKDDDASEA
ncbi:hypothetical protein WCLP8_3560019 [uncultured Gammaproteobacteria bacterium]